MVLISLLNKHCVCLSTGDVSFSTHYLIQISHSDIHNIITVIKRNVITLLIFIVGINYIC